ncbi:hypothetical protein ASPVEDRAFT_82474 [Aspergillus versicolor CBS 583.65]|uniref:Copper-fist domain-containing protein n=1 Tax=Aspergillus versicolor CBS 583.65 TaxID=1036611 RepID=A0A1L9PHB8_ASPVE|nr:uncharacterized protein ASPVEDRAFT_82474 [Aspergillus versicolor CBS 583.65]OJJ00924.1 hypothetical protein ASPVEDRAFT_82474 [Aspergillus versicolor CBS 583.65]
MASLFEFYGLTRRQCPEDNTLARRETSSKRAVEDVGKDTQIGSLGPTQSQIVSLLETVRELDWSDLNAKELRSNTQRIAAELHRRGEAVTPCEQCTRGGAWDTCVVFPVYKGRSVSSYACSNCIHRHRGNRCSHRQAFEDQGGQPWDIKITAQVVAHGGLRKVMAKESQDPTFSINGDPPIVTKKRKEREASTENQAQVPVTPKKPRLSSGSPRERSAFDGESLPWPVSPTSWNNPIKLRSIMKDLKSFAHITEVRIAKLEAERKRMSSTEYWNQEAADLFSDGQLNLGMRE